MCFCVECRGEEEPVTQAGPAKKDKGQAQRRARHELKTIRERIDQCGNACTIVCVSRVQLADGTVVDGRARFDSSVSIPFLEACEYLCISPEDAWETGFAAEEVAALELYAATRSGSEGAA